MIFSTFSDTRTRAAAGAGCAVFVAALSIAGAAQAGDYGLKGSYRGHHAKPVPAPAPIPEFEARYYVGAALTYSMASTGTISSSFTGSGTPFAGQSPFLVEDPSDLAGVWGLSLKAGRYLSRGLRAELTIDIRGDQKIGKNDTGQVTVVDGAGTHTFDYEREHKTRVGYHTGLVNLIYDFNKFYRVRPFIGVGAGITVYSVDNMGSVQYTCSQSTGLAGCAGAPTLGRTDSTGPEVSYGFALAFMGGLAFELANDKHLDVGYRGIWTSGSVTAVASDDAGSDSRIKIDERLDHELRIGIRWDLH